MTDDPAQPVPKRGNNAPSGPAVIAELRALLDTVLAPDYPGFERRLRGAERAQREGKRIEKALGAITNDMRRSADLRERRTRSVPTLSYPQDLPVSQRRDELLDVIGSNQVTIVCGETGSGKTTQLPKVCLELGRGIGGRIGHTQPRRIAARSVAARIAEELDAPGVVGTKMRFDDRTDDRTLVKVMTDGILLAETRSDPLLRQYDTIIIDEAHERSLNIDFLLGFLRRLLPKRPDLKLIITSATIDAQRFAEHFECNGKPAPTIEISGRMYPVEVRYARPPEDLTPEEAAADVAVDLIHEQRSDVLVFMPGEREIRQTAHALRHHPGLPEHAEIVPLYARLSPKEQQRAFKPSGKPRVVISTNVAETSITVPNIRAVIDPGSARIKRYSARSKIDQLLIEPISKASANQRAGRCGRIAPGVCVRLFDETDFDNREPFTSPELLRSDLAGVILQMIDLGLGDPLAFPFIDPPVSSRWRDGYNTLIELGAIDPRYTLTDLGKRMGRLPVDPRIARMILAGQENACLHDVLVIASALTVQDPRVRPHDKREAADQAHAEFRQQGSDFLTLRAIWDFYHEELRATSRRKAGKACEKRFLSVRRIDEWREVFRQISRLCREMGFDVSDRNAPQSEVHKSILTGLLANIGRKGEQREYQGTRNTRFEIAPGSACLDPRPKWVMAGEIVRTHKVFARTVASIKPEWIERAAEHLIKRTHTDPRWDEDTQRVLAEEKVVLEGLEIVPKRTVHYGPIDPVESRKIFIHHAFVEGEVRTSSSGVKSNRKLEKRARLLQAKARRSDFIADSEAVFRFYDLRIPADVFTTQGFERWINKAERATPDVVRMREEDVFFSKPEEITEAQFPDRADVFGSRLRIRYELAPGEDTDGASIRVTPQELHRITTEQAEWVVPGFVPARVNALVRKMPRDLRRRFDLDTLAAIVCSKIEPGSGALVHQIARLVSIEAGVAVRPEQFREDAVPDHLRPRFEVVSEDGNVLGEGRDLTALRQAFKPDRERPRHTGGVQGPAGVVTASTFELLPLSVELKAGKGKRSVGFPAIELTDVGTVEKRVLETPWEAERTSRIGFAALFGQSLKQDIKIRVRRLPGFDALSIHAAACGMSDRAEGLVLSRAGMVLCVDDRDLVRSKQEFDTRRDEAWDRAVPETQDMIALWTRIFAGLSKVQARLSEDVPEPWRHAHADIQQQLRLMTPDRWEYSVPTRWIRCFPRYFAAIETRFDRLRSIGAARDLAATREVYVWLERLVGLAQEGAERSEAGDDFLMLRWMLEEYRVSKFAQDLGTSTKVSEKAMRTQYDRLLSRLGTTGASI